MPSEADVKFEIGHVLFIDIVGYSKLLIHEQSERLQRLREIVRATETFRAALARSEIDPPADGRWRRACFPHEPGSAGEVCDGDCARIEEAS